MERRRRLDQRLWRDLAALPPVRFPQGRRARAAAELADYLRRPRAFLRAGRPSDRHERSCRRSRHAAARRLPDRPAALHRAGGASWPRPSTSSAGTGGRPKPASSRKTTTARPACNGCGICSGCPRGSMSKYSLSIWPKALDRRDAAAPSGAGAADRERRRRPRHRRRISSTATPAATEFQPARSSSSSRATASARRGCCWPVRQPRQRRPDQVGRNLLHHTLVGSEFWVDEPIDSHMGYVASLISARVRGDRCQPRLRQRLPVQLPDQAPPRRARSAAGWVSDAKAPWGRGHHEWFERHFGHGFGACSRSATTCRTRTTASR